jgi:hypothetical protein
MKDPELFAAAMAAAGYESTGRFAAEVLDVDPRNARRWLEGERELQGTVRILCHAIIDRPALAAELAVIRKRSRFRCELLLDTTKERVEQVAASLPGMDLEYEITAFADHLHVAFSATTDDAIQRAMSAFRVALGDDAIILGPPLE